ncbi:MAG TPA: FCD domain-containing protein [Ilumatobacter sp.]|nr:FCD domain-containing protein [Ilumatobacter sp.]
MSDERGRDGWPAVQPTHSGVPIVTGREAMRPLKTAEVVAREVVNDVVSRNLVPGDRLPSEAQMLSQYGVSRESLREGLRLLEVQGLITIKRGPGGGPMVGVVDAANMGRASTLYYHLAGATYAELFETWILVESLGAERAARNVNRDHVSESMRAYLLVQAEADQHELDEFVGEMVGFHNVVAALSNNRVLELLLSSVGQIVTHHIVAGNDPREVGHIVGPAHAEIAQAIKGGHARKARDLMEAHIRDIADFYTVRMGSRLNDYIDWR